MNIGDIYIREYTDNSALVYRIHKIGVNSYVSVKIIGRFTDGSVVSNRVSSLRYVNKSQLDQYFKVNNGLAVLLQDVLFNFF